MVVSVTAKVRMFETGGSKSFVSVFLGSKCKEKKWVIILERICPSIKYFVE